jgi:probable F420-dependent oxidoreductase
MNIGLVYPQTEFGSDPSAIQDYAQSAEGLGFSHILAYDHVLGANPDRPGGWSGVYTHQDAFQEPFVLFGFMAGLTTRIAFATGVLILPQRQTALVAKQAATLDVLCGGRFRLGVGLGWNAVEYTALAENFHNRGRRIEEQVEVLRLLWTQPLTNFSGRWHDIPDAGLNPLPVQRPIPIWFGGRNERALQRLAKIGDGWITTFYKAAEAQPALDLIAQTRREAGLEAAPFGIEARIQYADGNPQTWRTLIADWRAAGATHISLNTMGAGLAGPQAHLAAIRHFAEEVKGQIYD